jgi:hypothetical protein
VAQVPPKQLHRQLRGVRRDRRRAAGCRPRQQDPHGAALLFGRADITALVAGLKAGSHDHLLAAATG